MAKKTNASKKKTAAKNATSVKATMTKASFVRSLPSSSPAKEVVAKAAEQGITLDDGYVYKIRTLDNKAAGKSKGSKATTGKAGPKPKNPVSQHIEHVRALRRVILHVGIDRAR